MFSWRVTKYNPQFRNNRGHYLKDEWVSYWEIGDVFDGKKLTYDEYMISENSYIEAILSFMDCCNLQNLRMFSLEKYKLKKMKDISDSMIHCWNNAYEGKLLNKKEIRDISRLILRSYFWCRLKSEDMYVHFGDDYYMFIGSKRSCCDVIKKIEESGLFVEPFESPYLEERRIYCSNLT